MMAEVAYPPEFWLAAIVTGALMLEAVFQWEQSWAKPALLVYVTILFWYLGNMIYGKPSYFYYLFSDDIISTALLQVVCFLLTYRVLLLLVIPRHVPTRSAENLAVHFQAHLGPFLRYLAVLWALLVLVGTALIPDHPWLFVLWPPLGEAKVTIFPLSGVGEGFDFLYAAARYLHLLVCAAFGVIFVIARGRVRAFALVLVIISWPYFWFDRYRHQMLALLLPAMLCYWIFGPQAWLRKGLISAALLVFVNSWFLSVMAYRAGDGALGSFPRFGEQSSETRHLGLDMLEELCWMNLFIQDGRYAPNGGERYLAEIANVIPRTIWPNKPLIGVDYSIARGFGGGNLAQGVWATISTGMIGQGLANFGPIGGVASAAALMSLWTAILTGLWEQRRRLPRFLLFLVGGGLTFNLGRDISLLVLWPFAFGYLAVLLYERVFGNQSIPTVPETFPRGPAS